MTGYGIAEDKIAAVLGIAPKTLRKHCAEELETGQTVAIAKVAETLYAKATDRGGGAPTVTAAIFFLKARAGWREPSHTELTGKFGGPIVVQLTKFGRTV